MESTKIMIVEDEFIVAKDIETRLKRWGYYVSAVVSSGEEAIIRAQEDTPDLILMDMKMQLAET